MCSLLTPRYDDAEYANNPKAGQVPKLASGMKAHTALVPNVMLRLAIEAFFERHPHLRSPPADGAQAQWQPNAAKQPHAAVEADASATPQTGGSRRRRRRAPRSAEGASL